MGGTALVGYTGFVGSNIAAGMAFDGLYNSKNIEMAYGTQPELLVYAGLSAEKYLANNFPEKDYEQILQAQENIRRIAPRRLVLISTVDVIGETKGKDEGCTIREAELAPYGRNRYLLEQWVREQYPEATIVRLPGLFGKNIKKNFIYDYIHLIPFMLTEKKMEELAQPKLLSFYEKLENGFYRVKELPQKEKEELKKLLRELDFSALNFTDSRSVFQFYDLSLLAGDLQQCLKQGILLWHPATEPVSAGEVYAYLTGREFVNEVGKPVFYDFRTKYGNLWAGRNDISIGAEHPAGYLCGKEEILSRIKKFVESEI